MIRRVGGSLGLLGRILAILLLTVAIEFGASTFLYERAGQFSVREDEARRLAEHLVIARKLLAERPYRERAYLAHELTTDRYDTSWSMVAPPRAATAPELETARQEILAWEPQLAPADVRLRLISAGRGSALVGELRLPEGDWLLFRSRAIPDKWDFALSRIALALVPALGLLVIGGLLVRSALTPLRRLARATERVGLDGTVVLEELGSGEVRQLIRAFNAMQHRIHALIDDRTSALAAVGHDLRTPLARVQLRAEAIDAPELRQAIARDVGEMEAMVASLLAFLGGENDPEPSERTDVAVMVATIVDDAADRGEDASYTGPTHAELAVRRVGLRRAIGNLVENALHYGGVARVSMSLAGAGVCILVDDDGPGIPPDRLEDVLKPFTRLDQARTRNTRGLGLGLAIVARSVEREGGTLSLSNRPEGGLRVALTLPGTPSG